MGANNKPYEAIATVKGLVLGAGAAAIAAGLALTNPGMETYAEAAGRQLGALLQEEACGEKPDGDGDAFGAFLGGQCRSLIGGLTPQLQDLVEVNTQRSNYGLGSHFQTRFSFDGVLPEPIAKDLPMYEAAAVGVGTQVIIYRFEKTR